MFLQINSDLTLWRQVFVGLIPLKLLERWPTLTEKNMFSVA